MNSVKSYNSQKSRRLIAWNFCLSLSREFHSLPTVETSQEQCETSDATTCLSSLNIVCESSHAERSFECNAFPAVWGEWRSPRQGFLKRALASCSCND